MTDTRFPLRGCRYYHGARIVSADGRTEHSVNGVHSGAFVLLEQGPQTAASDLERAFPAGSWFALYDYGVGDWLEWTHAATLELT